MSSALASTEPGQSTTLAPTAASSKKRNKNKKKSAAKQQQHKEKTFVSEADVNGERKKSAEGDEESGDLEVVFMNAPDGNDGHTASSAPTNSKLNPPSTQIQANGHAATVTNGYAITPKRAESSATPDVEGDATAKMLEALSQEREALRTEVEQLRKQHWDLQSNTAATPKQRQDDVTSASQEASNAKMTRLQKELEESEAARERAEEQYETLLERVEKIKATLGERLKSDKAELDTAKDRIEEIEAEAEELRRQARQTGEEAAQLRELVADQNRELVGLRSWSKLCQTNWSKEKEELTRQLDLIKSELENTSSAMGEWEVIAMEERSMRENLGDKVTELEEQVASLRDVCESAVVDRDAQARAVDGLQRALGEIQEARKRELREMVESSEEQLQQLKRQVQDADVRAAVAEAARQTLSKEMEHMRPFDKEIKEKNLLIGKLRHEAIVLNDHLTKALRYIKNIKPEETIDRQIVTNHFLQFLALDRSDPKKFQILQVIAGLLNWTDEQREQAGLARPGTATNPLRLPSSAFQRTPSLPAPKTEFLEMSSLTGKESLAELWSAFLERSVGEIDGGEGGV